MIIDYRHPSGILINDPYSQDYYYYILGGGRSHVMPLLTELH